MTDSSFKAGFVSVLGPPNAGKSSLLNKLVGEKLALVSSKPQATRERLNGIVTLKNAQIIFVDTPGLHYSEKKLNKFLIEEFDDVFQSTEAFIFMASSDVAVDDVSVQWLQKLSSNPKALFVWNKSDLPEAQKKSEWFKLLPANKWLFVSAHTGVGIDLLLAEIIQLLPESPPLYPVDDMTDVTVRKLASEFIREQIMELTFEEVPYGATVFIESFEEKPKRCTIDAVIIVEHDSQKGILIGKGGSMIKQIGVLSRKAIEKLMDVPVRLNLRVKVDKNWTKDSTKLARYGYAKKI